MLFRLLALRGSYLANRLSNGFKRGGCTGLNRLNANRAIFQDDERDRPYATTATRPTTMASAFLGLGTFTTAGPEPEAYID